MARSKEFFDGVKECRRRKGKGDSLEICPHPMNSKEWVDWTDGWEREDSLKLVEMMIDDITQDELDDWSEGNAEEDKEAIG